MFVEMELLQDMNIRQIHKLIDISYQISKDLPINSRFRHVSLILCKNRIVAVGTNSKKTHPIARRHGYRFDAKHSELDAYIRVPDKNDKLVLVNFRFNRKGDLRNSSPCNNCIVWCREIFDEIWYSTDQGMKVYEHGKNI